MTASPSPKHKGDYLAAFALDRLEQLHCSQLPETILTTIVARYTKTARATLDRLAKRSITIPSIAKTFTESAKEGRACTTHKPTDEHDEKRAHDKVGVQGEDDFSFLPPDEWVLPTEAESERSQNP